MKIRLTDDANAYRITLDDPPLNILDIAMLEELRDALGRVNNDRHALILDAAGEKAFSAGASVQDHLGDRVVMMLASFHDCFRILARLDLVTVAFVRGAALGGGCELALGCDFVLASDRAKFSQPEINLGVFPPVAAYQLSRQLAPRKGLELLLTGDTIDGKTAKAWGLVYDAVPAAKLDTAVNALAKRIAGVPKNQLMMQKLMINQAYENMGLANTQMIATLFDGITRHSPEGLWFKGFAEQNGFHAAVKWRDSGRAIPEPRAQRPARTDRKGD